MSVALSNRSRREGGRNGFLYKVDAAAIKPGDDEAIREELLRVIEPVAGEIRIDRYEAVRDDKHNVVAYKVWGHR